MGLCSSNKVANDKAEATEAPANDDEEEDVPVKEFGKKGRRKSRTRAMITALSIVPTPGVCFKGIQQIRTKKLVTKVANPIVQPVTLVIP